jgi:hypothetical protein
MMPNGPIPSRHQAVLRSQSMTSTPRVRLAQPHHFLNTAVAGADSVNSIGPVG